MLSAEAHRAVLAWAEAIDGEDGALLSFATPEAVEALLYENDRAHRRRVVVRGPKVERAKIISLDGKTSPPSLTLELNVSGHRYVEDRVTTTLLSGDRSSVSSFAMCWRMELSEDAEHPWHVVAVGEAARSPD